MLPAGNPPTNHPLTHPVALIKVHAIANNKKNNNNNNKHHNNNVGHARAKIAREYFAFVFYFCASDIL